MLSQKQSVQKRTRGVVQHLALSSTSRIQPSVQPKKKDREREREGGREEEKEKRKERNTVPSIDC
jgi:hypothetical protein